MSDSKPRAKRIPFELTRMSLTDVAREMNISPQRVQQIEIRALEKLRRASRRFGLRDFLTL